MGWWWNSTTAVGSTPVSEAAASNDAAKTPVPTPPNSLPPPPEARAQILSREEQANQDLLEMLKEFSEQADLEREERVQLRQFPGRFGSQFKSQSRSIDRFSSRDTTPFPDDISPDSLYPTEIHCRSAFDYALFCQSFGGQFVNIYRYGGFRSCSNHWQDFWLCMRTRQWDEKDRAKAIREHYRKKAIKYKTGPSSEDIWEVRQEPVKDAFQDNLEELEKRIEEWKEAYPTMPDPWKKQSGVNFGTSQGT